MYEFILNMWIMRKITQGELITLTTKGKITPSEYQQILNTAQIQ